MKSILSIALVLPFVLAQDVWVAFINNATYGGNTRFVVEANITFVDLQENGVGYWFKGISGFLADIAPAFSYHIHVSPVAGMQCGAAVTGGHFDPFHADQPSYAPVKGNLSTYEVGDLAGKWGAINATLSGQVPSFYVVDPTLSLNATNTAFIGYRSIVIHAKNASLTRIACANILPFAEYQAWMNQNQVVSNVPTSTAMMIPVGTATTSTDNPMTQATESVGPTGGPRTNDGTAVQTSVYMVMMSLVLVLSIIFA